MTFLPEPIRDCSSHRGVSAARAIIERVSIRVIQPVSSQSLTWRRSDAAINRVSAALTSGATRIPFARNGAAARRLPCLWGGTLVVVPEPALRVDPMKGNASLIASCI